MDFVRLLVKHRAAIGVAAAVNVGACLFGFDTGVAGGTVSLASFKDTFDLASSPTRYTDASSNVVTLLNAGAFFGALAPPLTSRFSWAGRRPMMAVAGLVVLVGGVLQTAAQGPSLRMIYTGRVVAGFGIGLISHVAPVFAAETAPRELRGIMMSLFELFLVCGGMLAYWTTYGCARHLPSSPPQWRTPLSLQIVLAALVVVGSLAVPESPRWLVRQGRPDDAAAALAFLRGSLDTRAELAEIHAQIQTERAATRGRSLRELLLPHNLRRLLWALGVGLAAMWCGHNAILYYAPVVFAQIGYAGQNAALLASGVFTCIKVAATLVFLACGVPFFSRRTLLATGAFFMAAFLLALGALLATHPPHNNAGTTPDTPAARGMMALLYLYVVAYSVSWGPLAWVYIGEIFPLRIRDYGMALGTANVWLWNFVVAKLTPTAIQNIGWKTWMIFGAFNLAACLFACLLPETKDLSLEAMDVLFGGITEDARRRDIEKNMQPSNSGTD